ncbi:MAG: glycosyl hydrolase family 18 protein [Patescibacteria group bacterium]
MGSPDLVKTLVTIAAYLLANKGGLSLPPSGPAGARAVVGYYSEYFQGESAPYQSLKNNLKTLTAVAPFAYYLNGAGEVSGTRPTQAVSMAHAGGLKVLALVHNFTRQNGFEAGTAHRLLSSPAARERAAGNLLSLVRQRGYHGINLDLENVPASDRANLTAFVRRLAEVFRPHGLLVTASIPAKTSDNRNSNWSGAFDYAALGAYLDQVMLMSYDENGANGPPGPVASLPWVERVVRYARGLIPSRKILIGLAVYGYDWPLGKAGGRGREFKDIQGIIDRHGVAPKWDSAAKVPYLRYTKSGQPRVVWYENSWSAAYKLDLVNRYDLGGVAIWRLGGEDPRLWPVIRQKFGKA